ncbi:MAG TPA: methyltransferase [Thermoanaerobaculia bacterium]|nr:methyltransferase [Thermoanaerobaculia bacterium]
MTEEPNDRFHGWLRPGPDPPGGIEPAQGETLDYLSGRFRIFQLERGHRYSTDDLLTAWWGTTVAGRVERVLDLGSGIGSVAMLAAWRLPAARFVTLEAQEVSLALARKSVEYNGLTERFRLLVGDLRDPAALEGEEPFDLVLGSPPYYAPGTATPPRTAQAVPARIEALSDVTDYVRAASRVLGAGGTFACVSPTARVENAVDAARKSGLVGVRRRDVVFRESEPARICLLAFVRAGDVPEATAVVREGEPSAEAPLVIRRLDGTRGAEYAAIRIAMGFPPG